MHRLLLVVCAGAAVLLADGRESLFEAIRAGSAADVRRALDAGADASAKDDKGTPALVLAAVYGSAGTLRILIDGGANVNATNGAGVTALMASAGDLGKVRLLVEKGAGVNAKSDAGNTAVLLAGRLPSGADTVRYLMSKGAVPAIGTLRNALRRGDMTLARALIAAGVKPDGATATLQAAAVSGNVEAMRIALEPVGEKRPPAQGSSATTPVMLASFYGPLESVRLLLEKGASVNVQDNRGRSALMHAVASPHGGPAIVEALLKAGADESLKDVRGDTYRQWERRAGVAETVKTTAALPRPPLRESLQRALGLLDAAGPVFFKANGCISCHNQSIPQMAYEKLRRYGVAVSSEGAHNHAKAVLATWTSQSQNLWQTNCGSIGGQVATISYGLVGLAAVGHARTPTVDLVAHCLMAIQEPEGSWNLPDLRAPLGIGREKFTALSIRALQAFPIPGRNREIEERIARARRYLESARHQDTQALVFRILGLAWSGGDSQLRQRLTEELIGLQRSDGGWAQGPEWNSDAYATGQALWALVEGAGYNPGGKEYQAGAEYLRSTQRSDGSWYGRSRGFGFQPYRETGFPHGHDQWISAAATGFAMIGLAPMAAVEAEPAAAAAAASLR